jgi:hypothetical protein
MARAQAWKRGAIPTEVVDPRPPCFRYGETWVNWVAGEVVSVADEALSGFCEDCTSEYHAEMVAAGRCMYPATTFAHDPDRGEYGIREYPVSRMSQENGGVLYRQMNEAGLIVPDEEFLRRVVSALHSGDEND